MFFVPIRASRLEPIDCRVTGYMLVENTALNRVYRDESIESGELLSGAERNRGERYMQMEMS